MKSSPLRHPARLAGASLLRLQSDERLAELAIDVPLDLVWSGDTTVVGGDTYQASTGLGDIRLVPKVDFVRTPSFGFGLALPVRLPTGDDLALRGAGDLTVEPKVLLSFGAGALAFGLNVGYLVHASDEGREGPGGDALTFGETTLTYVVS